MAAGDDFGGQKDTAKDAKKEEENEVGLHRIREGIFRLSTSEPSCSQIPWETISPASSLDCDQSVGEPEKKAPTRHFSDQGVQVDLQEKKVLNSLKHKNLELKQQVSQITEEKRLSTAAEEGFLWLNSSPAKFYFYTGLSREEFDILLRFLGPDAESLQMWGIKKVKIHSRFQLALTLMRLRQMSTHIDLSYRFKMSTTTVGNVFVTWVQFLYLKFSALRDKMFAPRAYHNPLPKSFRNPLLRNVRVVIDCTEFYIESSSDFKQQGNLYSSYKSRPTAKVLIGVAPCGAAMFVSDCFEGAISDREIVKQSGFLDYIQKGDVVLADRGFTIEDLLAEKEATLVIPPFLGGRKAFTNEEMIRTKLIAKARIHVERYNERIKNNRILSGVLPHYLVPLLSQIVFVLCCIVNFQEPLAK